MGTGYSLLVFPIDKINGNFCDKYFVIFREAATFGSVFYQKKKN